MARLFFSDSQGNQRKFGSLVSNRSGPVTVSVTRPESGQQDIVVLEAEGLEDGRWIAVRFDEPWGASYRHLAGTLPEAATFPERFTSWAQRVRDEAVQALLAYIEERFWPGRAKRLCRLVCHANSWWTKRVRIEAWQDVAALLGARTRIGESWGQVHAAPAKIACRLGLTLSEPMPVWGPMPETFVGEFLYSPGDYRLLGTATIMTWVVVPKTPSATKRPRAAETSSVVIEEFWDAE